ncbi:FecCD family ABC transporter permease [Paenibacillus mucilaginosus]|uniref:Iron ABC transporter permease n=3 Tax=Paenibacillus mucilaginosus TaxID=61624 RepID=H6NHX8_9BACL|nr:iron chelate uptake ABC transporter family permease subunit [Paenibacillus mucilaginosus]AFC30199.1 iron ABC transporter permease [Paenibacillus mucilaginosus 3016]AFH62470.1 ABC transporter permease [Paenibacillus mucilaginosus K02]MCG7214382.1 iron chelate uptake ABC transporter family permease subunit [Paenibacillus mucilaginosus]WDM30668.1 iron chelate uptake ABC transporter family permease subunit [Paenibacillus mucilaginosus]WFA18844.1 iron ABC transporter permease [Paenibacillus muci
MKTTTVEFIMAGRRQRRRRGILVTGLLALISCLLCCAMLLLGSTIYPVKDVVRALAGEQIKGVSFAVHTLRLPRMLAGVFAGFAFGLAGNTFQTMLRNPLANPNVIGITSGSSAAAVFCILILHTSDAVVSAASVIAGLATVIIIYLLSRGTSFSVGRLILVGIGVQAMLSAVISYLLLVGAQQDIPAALRWLSGSLNGVQMHELPSLVITVLVLAPIVIVLGKHLSILELGEQSAASLGVHTDKTRIALIFSSVCMIALATAATGPIAFVAFLSGPIAKRLVGAGFSSVIPAGLVGVNLVLAADLFGQFAFETRFPVGIITGILGAPYLIFLLIRMNRKGDL